MICLHSRSSVKTNSFHKERPGHLISKRRPAQLFDKRESEFECRTRTFAGDDSARDDDALIRSIAWMPAGHRPRKQRKAILIAEDSML